VHGGSSHRMPDSSSGSRRTVERSRSRR
jgi:hypothetical protein